MLAPITPTLSGLKTSNHFFLSFGSWAFSCAQTVAGDARSLLHTCAWHPGWENSTEGLQGCCRCAHGSFHVASPAWRRQARDFYSSFSTPGDWPKRDRARQKLDCPFGLATHVPQRHIHHGLNWGVHGSPLWVKGSGHRSCLFTANRQLQYYLGRLVRVNMLHSFQHLVWPTGKLKFSGSKVGVFQYVAVRAQKNLWIICKLK